MAKSLNYQFKSFWWPYTKEKQFTFKSEDERKKVIKYNLVNKRFSKEPLGLHK